MGFLIDLLRTIEYVEENPTEVQLMCMIAILVVIVTCGYMVFRQGQGIWLAGGTVVIPLLIGLIYLCGKMEPV